MPKRDEEEGEAGEGVVTKNPIGVRHYNLRPFNVVLASLMQFTIIMPFRNTLELEMTKTNGMDAVGHCSPTVTFIWAAITKGNGTG